MSTTGVEPTPKQERAARAWREAKTAKKAWRELRSWLQRSRPDDDGDAPHWTQGFYSTHHAWTGSSAKGLLLFQKLHVMNEFLPDGKGSDWATRWRIATAAAPLAPTPFDVELIRAHAQLIGRPIGWFGDLDPHGLHSFGALRSGKLDAPDIAGQKLVVDWLGIDDAWLDAIKVKKGSLNPVTIRMKWAEREYWAIIKRFAPGLRQLIGDESFALLDSGVKIESEGMREVLPAMLRARVKQWRG